MREKRRSLRVVRRRMRRRRRRLKFFGLLSQDWSGHQFQSVYL